MNGLLRSLELLLQLSPYLHPCVLQCGNAYAIILDCPLQVEYQQSLPVGTGHGILPNEVIIYLSILIRYLRNVVHGYVLDAPLDERNWDHYKVLSSLYLLVSFPEYLCGLIVFLWHYPSGSN